MITSPKRGLIYPLLLLAAVAAGAAPASAATVCASSGTPPAQASAVAVANSALCLVNQERSTRGISPLKLNRHLATAATGHSRDMISQDYFSHTDLDGADFVDRIRQSGYIAPRSYPSLGEDIAWGSGSLGTPASIVTAWMA